MGEIRLGPAPLTFDPEDARFDPGGRGLECRDGPGQPWRRLLSVGRLLARYAEPFDQAAVAARVADRRGVAVGQVLAEWAEAQLRGTRAHEFAAARALGRVVEPEDGPQRAAAQFLSDIGPCRVLACEAPLYAPPQGIGGVVDLVVYAGKSIRLIDYKPGPASKAMRGWGSLWGCLRHLEASKHVRASLQASLYAWILDEHYGVRVDRCEIVYLGPKDTYTTVVARQYEREVEWLLGLSPEPTGLVVPRRQR